jgi:hypothetical protein
MAVDDGPFKFGDSETFVVGLVVRGSSYLEAAYLGLVEVDGTNVTEVIEGLVDVSKQRDQLKAMFLDGLTFAGFNVVDIEALHKATGVPVITVVDKTPSGEDILTALKANFKDWERRWQLLSAPALHRFELPDGAALTCHLAGIGEAEARELVQRTTVRGHIPEPLRMADLIASALPEVAGMMEAMDDAKKKPIRSRRAS